MRPDVWQDLRRRGRKILVGLALALGAMAPAMAQNAAPRIAAASDLKFALDEVIATFERAHAVSDEIIDVWRTEGDPFVHAWEDRFVVDHGYRDNVVVFARLG